MSPAGRRLRVIGFGMGPQHVTPEAARALASVDHVVAFGKSAADPLLEVRRAVCAAHGVPLVVVPDPPRDRSPSSYDDAVASWHDARVAALRSVLAERPGDVGMLVWGDPSLYDSTLRLVSGLDLAVDVTVDVVPGISAPSLLAARHRIVLHEVGRPVHVTTARRLAVDVAAGQDNLVVMLTAGVDHLAGLDDWSIWWGANLGAPGERLVAGRVGTVRDDLVAARGAAHAEDGWVMDVCLLRAPRA